MTQFFLSLFLALLLTPVLLLVAGAVYSFLNERASGQLEPYKFRIMAVTVCTTMLLIGLTVLGSKS